ARHVHMFAFRFEGFIVVGMSSRFGWLISFSEFRYSFTCSAAHIPGEQKTMADTGVPSLER
ncbi:hypothetical protein JG687_00014504, partial [Phytophthora cactorum]